MEETIKKQLAWLRFGYLAQKMPISSLLRLLKEVQSVEAVFDYSAARLKAYLKPEAIPFFLTPLSTQQCDVFLKWVERSDHHFLTLEDTAYPEALLHLPDPPPILFAKGQLTALSGRLVSIVGSRNATPTGQAIARQFAQSCAAEGIGVVSGLAEGIDAAAHEGVLEAAGHTIACIGTGIDRVYPAFHRDLAQRIVQQGLIVSEFPLGTPARAFHFPRRNRLISGLSAGCIVIEASLKSGSLITARLAAEQGKEVFAVPGSILSPHSHGCHALIREGVELVESLQQVLEALNWAPMLQRRLPFESRVSETCVDEAALDFLKYLDFTPTDIETLCERSRLSAPEVNPILFLLESSGYLTVLGGGLYQRTALI